MERTDFKFDKEASLIAERALLGEDLNAQKKDLKKKKSTSETPIAKNDDKFAASMGVSEDEPVEGWELVEIRAKFQREPDVEFYDAGREEDVEFCEDDMEDVGIFANCEEDVEEWEKASRKSAEEREKARKKEKDVENAHKQRKAVETLDKDVESAKYVAKNSEKSSGVTKDVESANVKSNGVEKGKKTSPDVENSKIGTPDVENSKIGTPDVENSKIGTPDVANSKIGTRNVANSKIGTRNVENAKVKSKDVQITKAKSNNDERYVKYKEDMSKDVEGRDDDVEVENIGAKDVEMTKERAQNVEDRDVTDSKKDIAQSEYPLGKFKNPEELLRAYTVLEKEFTRRSQRLKELERSVAPYASEEEWRDAADKFFKKTPSAKLLARDIAQEIALDPTLKEGRDCFDRALLRVLVKCYRTPEQLMSDGQFLKDYVLSSDVVKRAVIENYLAEMSVGVPPVTLPGGGQCSAAPTLRPRSVREAGDMLLRENK